MDATHVFSMWQMLTWHMPVTTDILLVKMWAEEKLAKKVEQANMWFSVAVLGGSYQDLLITFLGPWMIQPTWPQHCVQLSTNLFIIKCYNISQRTMAIGKDYLNTFFFQIHLFEFSQIQALNNIKISVKYCSHDQSPECPLGSSQPASSLLEMIPCLTHQGVYWLHSMKLPPRQK